MIEREWRAGAPAWQRVAVDVARAVRFYSRIPLPALPFETEPHGVPDLRALAPVLPLAGALIAVVPALVLAAALVLDFGPWLAAALSVAAMTLVTGAFHEDGLADTADGFGGGTAPERRLAIMRDPLVGSYGGSALVLAFTLRIAALATLADRLAPGDAALAVVIVAAVSRTAGLMPLALLPPARTDGAAYAVGPPSRAGMWAAAALAAGVAVLLGLAAGVPASGLALMLALAALAGDVVTRLSQRLIGGHSGDVAGAAQQLAEILALIGLLVAVEP
jgi:adenosylcobinamide-GDP ribazoletransferase